MKRTYISTMTAAALAVMLFTSCGTNGTAPAENGNAGVQESSAASGTDAGEQEKTQTSDAGAAAQEAIDASGAGEKAGAGSLSDKYARIAEAYRLPEMMLADDDWLLNYYGIDASMLSDYVFAEADETRADRIVMLRVADQGNMAAVKEKLEGVLAQLSSEQMLSYLPEQADVIKAAEVKEKGDLLYLVISEYADGIEAIITGE